MSTSLDPVVCNKTGLDEKHKAMTLLQPLIHVGEECDVWKERVGGEECHMTRRGWDSQLCWGCIRHECATSGLRNNDDGIVLGFIVLLCSWQMESHSPAESVFCMWAHDLLWRTAGSRNLLASCDVEMRLPWLLVLFSKEYFVHDRWKSIHHRRAFSACGLTTYYEELQVPGTSWRVVTWKWGYLDCWSFSRKNTLFMTDGNPFTIEERLLHVGSRHTMKNCRFPEPPGELWRGKEATLIVGPFLERILCSWQMESHSPSRSILLHMGSRILWRASSSRIILANCDVEKRLPWLYDLLSNELKSGWQRRTSDRPTITTYIPKLAMVTSCLLMNILYIST